MCFKEFPFKSSCNGARYLEKPDKCMIPDIMQFSLQSRSQGEERRGRMCMWQRDEVVAGELTMEGEEAAELNVRSSGLDRGKCRKPRQ